jgi:hypothetical protein
MNKFVYSYILCNLFLQQLVCDTIFACKTYISLCILKLLAYATVVHKAAVKNAFLDPSE